MSFSQLDGDFKKTPGVIGNFCSAGVSTSHQPEPSRNQVNILTISPKVPWWIRNLK